MKQKFWKKNLKKKFWKKNLKQKFWKKNVGKKILKKRFDKKILKKWITKQKFSEPKFIATFFHTIFIATHYFFLASPSTKQGERQGKRRWYMIQNRHAYCGVARSHWTQGMWRFERSREKRYITACRQFTQVSKFRRCQTSEVWIRDGDKITKSCSSEVSIHRKALYTTFRKPEVLFPRIVITPTYRSLESPKSRTVREVSLLRIFIPPMPIVYRRRFLAYQRAA